MRTLVLNEDKNIKNYNGSWTERRNMVAAPIKKGA